MSSGHSGSTLTNLILGTSKNAFSLGEIDNFQSFIEEKEVMITKRKSSEYICDCGHKLNSCKYWKDIVKEVKVDKLFPRKQTSWQRVQSLINILLNVNTAKNYQDKQLFSLYLKQAQKTKGKQVNILIDSSKNIRRLHYLTKLKNIDLKVIWIVKDGRGVVRSYDKRKQHWIPTYTSWVFLNMLTGVVFRRIKKKNKLRYSYDAFAQKPGQHLTTINKKFGTQVDLKNYVKQVNKEQYHNFEGNMMRQRQLKAITYDQSWKTMPKWRQTLLGTLCYIPNKAWVYNKKKK